MDAILPGIVYEVGGGNIETSGVTDYCCVTTLCGSGKGWAFPKKLLRLQARIQHET